MFTIFIQLCVLSFISFIFLTTDNLRVLTMGWKSSSQLPETSQRGHENDDRRRRLSRQDDSLRLPETHRRKRRNAMTLCMMEDLLQSENFQSLLNIHSTRRNSRSAGTE